MPLLRFQHEFLATIGMARFLSEAIAEELSLCPSRRSGQRLAAEACVA